MGNVILICGKLCSGKSSYAVQLQAEMNAVILSIDEVMLAIFGQYAGEKHDEYTANIKKLLLSKSVDIARSGVTVILDWGFWTVQDRQDTTAYINDKGIQSELHYLDVDEDTWRQRIQNRNRAVMDNEAEAYFIDDKLLAKCHRMFEEPLVDEVDIWVRH